MPGSTAPNLHEGGRSEIIADYLFSTWGTVTPVRRQDDFGVDLYCTLTERVGQRAMVTGYYSVQVKSNTQAWVFAKADEIRWLIEHPTPLFLACVDKCGGVLSVYQTIPRFVAGFSTEPYPLELLPSNDEEGRIVHWCEGQSLSLSAPILRVSLSDLCDTAKLERFKSVMRFWVELDQHNCMLRRMGVLRVQTPSSYRVNELPDMSEGFSERGQYAETAPQLKEALATLGQQLDYVGRRLLACGDRRTGLLAALLLQHLREAHGMHHLSFLASTWAAVPTSLEDEVGARLDGYPQNGKGSCDPVKPLVEVCEQLNRLEQVARFLSDESGKPAAADR